MHPILSDFVVILGLLNMAMGTELNLAELELEMGLGPRERRIWGDGRVGFGIYGEWEESTGGQILD